MAVLSKIKLADLEVIYTDIFVVVVRLRPFIDHELKEGKVSCVKTSHDYQNLSLVKQDMEQREFKFDHVLDTNSNQD